MRARSNGVYLQVALMRLGIGAVVLATWGMVHAADANSVPVKFSREQVEFYQDKIQPILAENCYK